MPYYDAINWAVETLSAKRIVALPTGSSSAPTLELAGTVSVTGTTTLSGATTISGALTTTSTFLPTSSRLGTAVVGQATTALVASQSGQLIIGAVDAAITLPLATVGAGINFIIMCGTASAGTGLTIVRAGSDTIATRTNAAGGTAIAAGTTITNSGATDIVGDFQWLMSDGVSVWRMISMVGTWA